ncbi:hypothetical protein FHR72_004199 [Mycolicibacterium iranicum]|uniref:Uncharacterized protein n=1 Tax=Mycolicibacterium iranicum TaxID=912594 RepID=A0A839QDX8_MYCIR|nr:hypothetical protein [Mycolicibacterium iranicum]MBB2992695.1 hypothetical protein [Mycolicibacterium iranicum]
MTTPDRSPLGDASEADLAEQSIPVIDTDDETWPDAAQVGADRDWQASEADLVEQAIAVPEDDSDFDR